MKGLIFMIGLIKNVVITTNPNPNPGAKLAKNKKPHRNKSVRL